MGVAQLLPPWLWLLTTIDKLGVLLQLLTVHIHQAKQQQNCTTRTPSATTSKQPTQSAASSGPDEHAGLLFGCTRCRGNASGCDQCTKKIIHNSLIRIFFGATLRAVAYSSQSRRLQLSDPRVCFFVREPSPTALRAIGVGFLYVFLPESCRRQLPEASQKNTQLSQIRCRKITQFSQKT